MSNNASLPHISKRNFPAFFREEFPALIKFVSNYYEFLELKTDIRDVGRFFDLDAIKVKKFIYSTGENAPSERDQILDQRELITKQFDIIIERYLAQTAYGVPNLFRVHDTVDGQEMLFPGFAVDGQTMNVHSGEFSNARLKFGRERLVKFLRNASAVYLTKGTEHCLAFLFRFLFDAMVTIEYPKERVLRASHSTWHVSGRMDIVVFNPSIIPRPEDELVWRLNLPGDKVSREYRIVINTVKRLNDGGVAPRYLITYDFDKSLRLDAATLVNASMQLIRDGEEIPGIITPNKTLTGFQISIPGNFWYVGKVFTIPSIYQGAEPTEVLVTNVDEGKLTGIRILNFGSGQVGTRSLTTTPLRDIWFSGKSTLSITEHPGGARTLKLKITENSETGFEEIVQGYGELSSAGSVSAYYQQPYNSPYSDPDKRPYVWDIVTSTGYLNQPAITQTLLGFSYADWMESQTVLVPLYEYIAQDNGKYKDSSGHLSDSYSVLQDNFLFQEYSYVVESNVDVQSALTAIGFNHPAGLKHFFNSSAAHTLDFRVDDSIVKTLGTLLFIDAAAVSDVVIRKYVLKPIKDSIETPADVYSKKFIKNPSDEYDTSLLDDSSYAYSYYDLPSEYYKDNSYYVKYLQLVTA